MGDHLGYRYEILEILGRGSFGTVLRVHDHKMKEQVALKIIRNKQKFHNQAMIELNILNYIKDHDTDQQSNVVLVKDFMVFRKHVVSY